MPKYAPRPDSQLHDELRAIARQMRHEPTLAEALLWHQLRHRQLCGYRFHRQHRVDRFIVDFVCLRSGLVIEVDGEVHQHQIEADQERERILIGLGYRVVRFTNEQVIDQMDEVLQKILSALNYTDVHITPSLISLDCDLLGVPRFSLVGTPSPNSRTYEFGEGAGG